MISNFSKTQNGGVSPQFAITISAIFLVIGCGLYFEGDTAYRLFDDLMNEIRYAVRL